MKKLSLIIFVLLFAACSKKGSVLPKPTPPVKVTLLSKATYTYAGTPYVDTYTYDDKNRLIDLNTIHAGFDYKYTYDSNNNLTVATVYMLNGSLARSARYAYSGNTMTVTEYDENGTLRNTHNWTLNAQKFVTTWVDLGITTNYNYDMAGNISSWSGTSVTVPETYTYDNKKHPLSMLGAINYHLMYFGSDDYSSFINNSLTSSSRKETASYTYSADGFPVTANVTEGANAYTITYEYIVN